MLKSKALKFRIPLRNKPKKRGIRGLLEKARELFKEHIYWPLQSFYNRYTERIGRSYAFARIGWLNYDFDASTIWDLLQFKLKRIRITLQNGHAIQYKEDMAALDEAIAITGRLYKEEYMDGYYRAHDKKWGKIRSKHIPNRNEKGEIVTYTWLTSRRKANTPSKKKRESQELRRYYDLSEKDRVADLERYFEIIRTHSQKWWD